MATNSDVTAIVDRVLRQGKALPTRVEELDKATLRTIEDEAHRKGLTPQAVLDVIRAARADAIEPNFDPSAIALEVRSRQTPRRH